MCRPSTSRKQDGDWLKTRLNANGTGPTVTMKLIEKVRLATKGGTGYNVFGDLPGTVRDGTFVLLAAHHDAYFHSGTDDTDVRGQQPGHRQGDGEERLPAATTPCASCSRPARSSAT